MGQRAEQRAKIQHYQRNQDHDQGQQVSYVAQQVQAGTDERIPDAFTRSDELEQEPAGRGQEFGPCAKKFAHDRHSAQAWAKFGQRQVNQKIDRTSQHPHQGHQDAGTQPVDCLRQSSSPVREQCREAGQHDHGGNRSGKHAGQLTSHAHQRFGQVQPFMRMGPGFELPVTLDQCVQVGERHAQVAIVEGQTQPEPAPHEHTAGPRQQGLLDRYDLVPGVESLHRLLPFAKRISQQKNEWHHLSSPGRFDLGVFAFDLPDQ